MPEGGRQALRNILFGLRPLSVRICDKVNKCHRSPYSKARMPGLKSSVTPFPAMTGTVQTSQLRQILC